MQKYIYEGPVTVFGTCVMNRWIAETTAVSRSKAMNNLKYRYKTEHNMVASSKIELPGEIREV